jgi:predicted nucleic acid-binding protein
MRALLDISFFVVPESRRPLGEMDGVTETEVSVVTFAELTVGVLTASDADRAARVATPSAVESTWDPLPVEAEVARQFARIVAALHADDQRIPILDAPVEQIPVVTQDQDYDAIPGVEVIQV